MEILFKEASFKSWINTLVGTKKNNVVSNDLTEVLKNSDLNASTRQELQDCQNKRVKKIEEEYGQIEKFERIDSNKKKSSTLMGKKVENHRNSSIKKGEAQIKEDMEIGNR